MASFIDANGQRQQVNLDVTMYREAADRSMSLPQYLNSTMPTDAEKFGSTFEQICASEGIVLKADRAHGLRPSTMAEILEGRPSMEAGVTTKEPVPASRIVFPAVILQAVENKLVDNLTMTQNALDSMIGIEENINGDRYEWPVLDFTKPEAARAQRIAQLAMPASMMTITVSESSKRVPTYSLGLEVSEQALKATSLDFVALSIARQAAIERNERANDALLAVLNGDVDSGDASLASLGQVMTTAGLDSTAAAGTITQKAWVKFLMHNATKKTVSHIVTDIDTALKIESRTGRPTIQTDNPQSPRIDSQFSVLNPLWPTQVNLFINTSANWPASTIMSLDKRYSLRRVTALTASYSAIEAMVMRRSTSMRFDFGWEIHRMFNDATEALTVS